MILYNRTLRPMREGTKIELTKVVIREVPQKEDSDG